VASNSEDRTSSSLLTALEKGTPPQPLRASNRPDLVPEHPNLELNQPSRDDTADASLTRAGEWGRDWVVVDTRLRWASIRLSED